MFVLLDTNIFVKDFFLESNYFSILKKESYWLGIKLFVSSVVVDEVVQKYKEKLEEFNKKNQEFSRIISPQYIRLIQEDGINSLVEEFREEFSKKLSEFNQFGTRHVHLYDIDFGYIYNKAINKKKPFKENGSGFKDTLIWEHVKWVVEKYCDENRKLAFITDNIGDFSDKVKFSGCEWYLPSTCLREDYTKEDYPDDTVRIYESLKSFVIDVVYKKLDGNKEFIENLNSTLNNKLINYIFSNMESENYFIDNDLIKQNGEEYELYEVSDAKAINAYNKYGEVSDEAVFEVKFRIKLRFNSNQYIMYEAKTYISINVKTNEFIYMEDIDLL